MTEKFVDTDVYLPVMKTLLQKYGDFKVSEKLHNFIIASLADICEAIEAENKGNKNAV